MKNYTAITFCSCIVFMFLTGIMASVCPNALVSELPVWLKFGFVAFGVNLIIWFFVAIRQLMD